MESPSLIFITGGVRSGKSSFAERLAVETAAKTGGRLHYIATGVSFDDEMKIRIRRHREDRQKSGLPWQTWEQPENIGLLASFFTKEDIILLDCITTLVNNELFFLGERLEDSLIEGIYGRVVSGIDAIRKNGGLLIAVSNEVLFEPYGDDELLLRYRNLLGKIHQKVVGMADEAYLVEAGVPLLMKGKRCRARNGFGCGIGRMGEEYEET